MSKRVPYRFRTDIEAQSLDSILTDFLRSKNAVITEKEKVLNATRAYWLPFALKDRGEYSDEQLKHYARTAIYKLQMHINYLAENFGLFHDGEQAMSLDEPLGVHTSRQRPLLSIQQTPTIESHPHQTTNTSLPDLENQVE
ncbi:MAG: hypothetical protein KME21_31975 [Desmonostoc vinosum HA7617-LM4]|jgi:hypothetical protein|nr:hypothetical protein [Desmonostoc vinosum HA7617-LM4]